MTLHKEDKHTAVLFLETARRIRSVNCVSGTARTRGSSLSIRDCAWLTASTHRLV